MMESSQILLTFTVCCLMTQSISGLHVNPSGGYSDVLVKIEDGVNGCDVVVENLKQFLSSSSDALDSALSGEKSQINLKDFPIDAAICSLRNSTFVRSNLESLGEKKYLD